MSFRWIFSEWKYHFESLFHCDDDDDDDDDDVNVNVIVIISVDSVAKCAVGCWLLAADGGIMTTIVYIWTISLRQFSENIKYIRNGYPNKDKTTAM